MNAGAGRNAAGSRNALRVAMRIDGSPATVTNVQNLSSRPERLENLAVGQALERGVEGPEDVCAALLPKGVLFETAGRLTASWYTRPGRCLGRTP